MFFPSRLISESKGLKTPTDRQLAELPTGPNGRPPVQFSPALALRSPNGQSEGVAYIPTSRVTYGLLAILRMARLQSQVDAFHIDGQALFMF